MKLFLIAATIINAVAAIKSSYNIVQHHSPSHSKYSFNSNPIYSPVSYQNIHNPHDDESTYQPHSFTGAHNFEVSFGKYSDSPHFSSHHDLSEPSRSDFGGFVPYAQQLFAPIKPVHGSGPPPTSCGGAPAVCLKSKYRSLDGSCNNLKNTAWGVANSRYARLLTAKYGDGVAAPTNSVTGEDLPNSRLVSLAVFNEADVPDPQFTLANMQWGQIITHDMSMLAGSTQSKRHGTRCCTDQGKLMVKAQMHKTCYPIVVPKNDPAHSQTKTECMNFVRTLTDQDASCSGNHYSGQAEQLTVVTAFMDLSLVYGNNDDQNRPIRAFQSGRMVTVERKGYEWPPQAQNASASCDVQTPDEICYRTGDVRTNQNPGLATLQIILLREHNRIADVLQHLNPHWEDELVFQEARRINIAQYEHISYYEWLPIFLGTENMLKNHLIYKTTAGSYVNDYNSEIDPSVLNEHATAAFRYFHSQIEGRLDLISEIRSSLGSLRLSDWFNRPAIIEANDNYDSLTRGLATQPEQLTDNNYDPEIRHFLFRGNRPFGGDLRAIDIQRNRDHGLASYNDVREYCGQRRAHSWEDFLDLISPKDLEHLQSVYSSFEDVDLTVGGSLETHVAGTLAGPTFLCILTEQFYRTRVGDRFFYENGVPDTAFTRAQLQEIRKASVARLFCDNSNHIHSIQPSAFMRVSDINEIRPCDSIPIVDLTAWKDISSKPHVAHHESNEGYFAYKV